MVMMWPMSLYVFTAKLWILSYRIVNDADDYEITCKVLIRDSSREHMGYESDYGRIISYWLGRRSYATKYHPMIIGGIGKYSH